MRKDKKGTGKEIIIPNGYDVEDMLDTDGADYLSEKAEEEKEVILRFEAREKAGR